MCDDKDIKIAGNYPSREIKKSPAHFQTLNPSNTSVINR